MEEISFCQQSTVSEVQFDDNRPENEAIQFKDFP